MKNFSATGIMLFIFLSSFCQTQKAHWLLGGNMSYTSTTQKENGEKTTFNVFKLNPKIGYFPIDNLAIILNTDYSTLSVSGFSDHTLTIGPAVRYYFPGSEGVRFFGGAGIGFASTADSHGTSYQFEAVPHFS